MCDYARISFLDLGGMRVDDFRALLRDAFIYRLQQSEGGREYLDKCWMLKQTTPDRKRLREKFGKPMV